MYCGRFFRLSDGNCKPASTGIVNVDSIVAKYRWAPPLFCPRPFESPVTNDIGVCDFLASYLHPDDKLHGSYYRTKAGLAIVSQWRRRADITQSMASADLKR